MPPPSATSSIPSPSPPSPLSSPPASKDRPKNKHPWSNTVAGAFAGAVEAGCLHPVDTIKTRLQLQQVLPDGSKKYRNTFQCGATIVREEGARALYKGLGPFMTHLVTKYALRFSTYTAVTNILVGPGKTDPWRNFVAGLAAGALEAVVIVTPFEVVKIRLQAQHGMKAENLKYHGPIDAVKKIVRQEGVTALWKGVVPTVVRNSLNQAFNFWSYDFIKRNLWGIQRGESGQMAPYQSVLTGMVSGSLGPIVNCPADVIKTRLMRQETVAGQAPRYKGMIHAFFKIWREEGYFALYKGLGPRLLRLAPGQAITWTVVEQVNKFLDSL